MRFLKTYGRVLGLLGRDIRIAGFLAFANLMVAGLQFLDPVLFGRVVNLLTRSDSLPQSLVGLLPGIECRGRPGLDRRQLERREQRPVARGIAIRTITFPPPPD